MLATVWELRTAPDTKIVATERRIGRDGFGAKVNEPTGRAYCGTLVEVYGHLTALRLSPVNVRRPPDVLEVWSE